MEIETDKDGRTIITSNDIGEILAYFRANDKREVEELRPVLVMTIDDPVNNGGYQRPNVDLGQALVASIELSGYSATDACIDDPGSSLYRFDFPDETTWSNPICAVAPRWDIPSFHFKQLDAIGKRSKVQKKIAGGDSNNELDRERILKERIKVVVLASHELRDQYIARAMLAWRDTPEKDLPLFIHHGPDGGSIVPIERVRFAREKFVAELRFTFNHAISFCKVAKRALFKVLYDADIDKLEARRSLPHLTTYAWEWSHPLFLQVLHLLNDMGRIGTHEHRLNLSRRAELFSFAHLYAEGLPIFEKAGDGYELIWQGSGAFDAWRMHIGKAPRPDEQEPLAYSSHFTHTIFNIFQHIHHTGLLGLDGRQIVLSPWGVEFIKLLGPATRDPDVLLRWRSGEEIGKVADVSQMDSWVVSTFTAAKNSIDNYLFGEEATYCDDPEFLSTDLLASNRISIVGIHIPTELLDLDDPAFVEEVAKIAESESRIPVAERYRGLIYNPPRMKTAAKLRGIWMGVPLEVTSEFADKEPGWLKDTSLEYKEALQVLKAASPAISSRIAGQMPSIIHGLPIKEKSGELRTLHWKLTSTKPENIRPIILGVVSTIDLNADLPERLRIRLGHFTQKLGVPKYYNGINHFAGVGSNYITTTCGHFIGLYDEADGAYVIDREVNPQRVEAFNLKRDFMMGNLKTHFAIDRKAEGYWTVLKDGTTKRIVVNLNS